MLTSWQVPEHDGSDAPVDTGLLVSLHFLLAALRRRWRTWVGMTLVGLMLGVAWVSLVPPTSTGTVTLFLAHDPNVEPDVAMATDVSLLRTRTVAASLIDRRDLNVTPEDFQASVVTTPVTPQVLQIDVPGTDDAEARATAAALAEVFLDFRATQLRAGADAIVAGNRERVERIEAQADVLTDEFERLSDEGQAGQGEAAGVLNERSRLTEEIVRLQQANEETTLQTEAVLAASIVIDPADVVPRSALKRWVLTVGSALVGGLGVGIGFVLVTALASNRLRRRDEVALALGVPVAASATRSSRRALAAPVRAVVGATQDDGRRVRLAVAGVGGTKDHQRILVEAVTALVQSGSSVFLVDLGARRRFHKTLARRMRRRAEGAGALTVLRPESRPVAVRGPLRLAGPDAAPLPDDDPRRAAYDAADVVLVLTEIEPTTDLDEVAAWADEVVLVVEAGRSSAEGLRSVAELVKTVGLGLSSAVLTGADRTDESLGLVGVGEARGGIGEPPARRSVT
jgi:capsular polysaccharide biosynthesis protein